MWAAHRHSATPKRSWAAPLNSAADPSNKPDDSVWECNIRRERLLFDQETNGRIDYNSRGKEMV